MKVLELTRTQSQRIVTRVRRAEPTFELRIGDLSGVDLGRRVRPVPFEKLERDQCLMRT